MTVEELQAKRDAVLAQIEVAQAQMGDKSISYVADKQKILSLLDTEIAAVSSASNNRPRTTYATFRND